MIIIIHTRDAYIHREASYTTIVIITPRQTQTNLTQNNPPTTIPDLTDSESDTDTDNDTIPDFTDTEPETESETDSGFED